MSKLNLDITDASPASSINGPKEPLPLELEDMLKVIERFFTTAGAIDVLSYKNGMCKNAHVVFKPSTFLKSINLLLYNTLKESNKEKAPILKPYFESLNTHLEILDSLNLNVAEREFICNIIGYTINCYKNNTFDTHNKNND